MRFRVQVRTETPLNYVHFRLQLPERLLTCEEGTRVLLEDPEFPDEPVPAGRPLSESSKFGLGRLEGWFFIGGSHTRTGNSGTAHGDRAWIGCERSVCAK